MNIIARQAEDSLINDIVHRPKTKLLFQGDFTLVAAKADENPWQLQSFLALPYFILMSSPCHFLAWLSSTLDLKRRFYLHAWSLTFRVRQSSDTRWCPVLQATDLCHVANDHVNGSLISRSWVFIRKKEENQKQFFWRMRQSSSTCCNARSRGHYYAVYYLSLTILFFLWLTKLWHSEHEMAHLWSSSSLAEEYRL